MKFTNIEAKNLVNNMQTSSQVFILEEGKEKNELIERAKKRGILVKNSTDLGVIKTIYAFADEANQNDARLKEEEIVPLLPQIVGKPMNRNHIRDKVRGFYFDYKYDSEYKIKGKKRKAIIAYSTFLKNIFADEWKEAKNLAKQNRLATSFEIWSPKEKREYLKDGSFYMHDMEISGGGLLFDSKEDPIPPAYDDAKVLDLAKQLEQELPEKTLVFASKYSNEKQGDLIIADIKKSDVQVIQPNNDVIIKCGNCGIELNYNKIPEFKMGCIKCPECKAIIDQTGKVLYPPQQMNFKFSCLNDRCIGNIILEEQDDKYAIVSCTECKTKYKLIFAETRKFYGDDFPIAKVLKNLPNKTFKCPQCGHINDINNVRGISDEEVMINCGSCSCKFPKRISYFTSKVIGKVIELKDNKENNPEGGKSMNLKELFESVKTETDVTDEIAFAFYYSTEDERKDLPEEAVKWTRKYINDLPDSAFAVIEPAYLEGKTDNKNARHLPFKNKEGKIDLPHLRNALARVNQIEPVTDSISAEELKKKATAKLEPYKKMLKTEKKTTKASSTPELSKEDKLKAGLKKYVKLYIVARKMISDYEKALAEAKEKEVSEVARVQHEQAIEISQLKDANAKALEEAKQKSTEELDKIKKESEEKIAFIEANANKIEKSRIELGDFAKDENGNDLTDEQLADDKIVENARLRKIIAEKEDDSSLEKSAKKEIKNSGSKIVDRIAYGI